MRLVLASLVALGATGCAHFHHTAPTHAANAGLSSQYVFRGVVFNERPVAQADGTIAFAGADGDVLSGTLWANMDLDNSTGDAISPDGNDWDFTEIDLLVDYARRFGEFDASFGLVNYNRPNTPFPSTTELYAGVAFAEVLFRPSLTMFVDIDEADGVYLSAAGQHRFPIADRIDVDVGASLGLATENFAEVYYLADDFGLADFALWARGTYALTPNSRIGLTLTQWALIEGDFRDGLEDAVGDIDTTPLVLALSYSGTL